MLGFDCGVISAGHAKMSKPVLANFNMPRATKVN